jgi:hypothetical protein
VGGAGAGGVRGKGERGTSFPERSP